MWRVSPGVRYPPGASTFRGEHFRRRYHPLRGGRRRRIFRVNLIANSVCTIIVVVNIFVVFFFPPFDSLRYLRHDETRVILPVENPSVRTERAAESRACRSDNSGRTFDNARTPYKIKIEIFFKKKPSPPSL